MVATGLNPVVLHTGRTTLVHGSVGLLTGARVTGGVVLTGDRVADGAPVSKHDGRSRHRREPEVKSSAKPSRRLQPGTNNRQTRSWKNDPSYISAGTSSSRSEPSHALRFQHSPKLGHGLSVNPGPSVAITWKPLIVHAGRTGATHGDGAVGATVGGLVSRSPNVGARELGDRVKIGGSVTSRQLVSWTHKNLGSLVPVGLARLHPSRKIRQTLSSNQLPSNVPSGYSPVADGSHRVRL